MRLLVLRFKSCDTEKIKEYFDLLNESALNYYHSEYLNDSEDRLVTFNVAYVTGDERVTKVLELLSDVDFNAVSIEALTKD